MKKELRILRDLIREELGRNMQSPQAVDVMQDWRHLPGISTEITAHPSMNGFYAKVTTEDGEGDTPMRFFADEPSASFWARDQVLRIQSKKMSSNPEILRKTV